MFKKILSSIVIVCFFLNTGGVYTQAQAGTILNIPAPGTLVSLSLKFTPALIKGLTVHKDNPFLFDFIVDPRHDTSLRGASSKDPVIASQAKQSLKEQSLRMIKYFFASLTIPDK